MKISKPEIDQFEKRQQRLIKNRQAADASRKRKKEQFEYLEQRTKELETQNSALLLRVQILEKINAQVNSENILLKNELSKYGSAPSASPIGPYEIPTTTAIGQYDIPSPVSLVTSPMSLNSTPLTPITSHDSPTSKLLDGDSLFGPLNEQELFDDYFNLEPSADLSKNIGIFTIFLFSIASFLLPSSFMVHGDVPVLKTLPESLNFPVSTFDVAHLGNAVAIPTAKDDFLNSIELWSKIDPPNAALTIESLFQDNSFALDAEYAVIPPTIKNSHSRILLGPKIKIVPYARDADSLSEDLRLSLLAQMPAVAGLGVNGAGGVLKLDMQVFAATWLTETE